MSPDTEQLIPVYGFLQGDTIGLLILAYSGDSMLQVAAKLQEAARVRVKALAQPQVIHKNHRLPPELTVAQAGIQPLDRIDVVEEKK